MQSSRKISYEWHQNNKTIRTDRQPRFTIRNDGSLRITKTDLDDSGIYQCIAIATAKRSNIVRKKARSRTAKLTVEGESVRFIYYLLNERETKVVFMRQRLRENKGSKANGQIQEGRKEG